VSVSAVEKGELYFVVTDSGVNEGYLRIGLELLALIAMMPMDQSALLGSCEISLCSNTLARARQTHSAVRIPYVAAEQSG
jgi:hypothetical protein